ncbi:LacI family transcriptional regulator [Ornithinimicrobium pekingense]|uniref:LacI family transcriptional regulator n=2 Tax=Ornithinimicrobium pekingense TaxID=384677 RepID=A0ABQ2FC42_9MICO|nr:LacI family transcriptional regulator [Ornithinimicrobium pekingense]
MYDVAREAGVSHQTVSRVINDAPNVAAGTSERVREAMARLGYRPSASARSLAARRSRVIGVVTFVGPYFGPMSTIQGVEAAARARGYTPHTVSLAGLGLDQARGLLDDLLQRDVEGLVVVAPTDEQAGLVDSVIPRELPVLALEARLPGRPLVASDNVHGGELAAEHLVSLGHTRIGLVAGPPDWSEARLRTVGFESVLAASGLAPAGKADGDWSARSGYEAWPALRDAGVTAVYVANDQMALGVLSALCESGLRVPEDVSVVGYDNTPESGWYYPPLTTVEQEFRRAGEVGIEQLVRLVEGTEVEPEVLVSPALVVRRSTGAPAGAAGSDATTPGTAGGGAATARAPQESLSRPG